MENFSAIALLAISYPDDMPYPSAVPLSRAFFTASITDGWGVRLPYTEGSPVCVYVCVYSQCLS